MAKLGTRQRETLSSMATIYGCCGLFDLCGDQDLISLSLQGSDPFLDWLGWEKSQECVIKRNFIAWNRPEYGIQGTPTAGYLSDPCDDPSGVEFGVCDFTLTDYGRLRREGPVRDVTMNAVSYCETQPRYRLDGTVINDDREFDARVVAEVLLQDLRRQVVIGNAATGGQFSGLENLVKTGYKNADGSDCGLMDSAVVDWNANGMGGGAGMTFNGNAINAGFNFVDVLLDVYRRLRQRLSWSPTLAAQPLSVGDIILVMPTHLVRCLLDHYTCWSVCEGTQYNEVALQSYEGRTFRNGLNGGMFNSGKIYLDGFEIPLIAYDWELIKGPTLGDVYMLTGQVGAVKTFMGQYNDMSLVPPAFPESNYFYTDGGRFLGWIDRDETCVTQTMEIRPRLLCWAPWLQARFQNVRCETPTGPITADPVMTSFFPQTSFDIAAC